MVKDKENSIFSQHINRRKNLIKDKSVLQSTYLPEELPHRKEQIDNIASILSIGFNGEKPSNIMVYGLTGTGKTAVISYIGKEIKKEDPKQKQIFYIYVNCEIVDTSYGILYNIASQFIDDIENKIPFTGWSFEKLYEELCKYIKSYNRIFIIVLDEIDHLISKKGDEIFYYLSKINEHLVDSDSKVSIIGISNNIKFLELLEPKARSRLGGESIVFSPYQREELENILRQRTVGVFEEGVLNESVITYCATLAARNSGDARMAIDLLRTATDIAERNGDSEITEAHVRSAKNSIEINIIKEAINTLTPQSKIILMSIIKNDKMGNEKMRTGEVYNTYKSIATCLGMPVLTQKRVTELISELDMAGIINANVKSFGKNGGRTKEITLELQPKIIQDFESDPLFKPLIDYVPPTQMKLM